MQTSLLSTKLTPSLRRKGPTPSCQLAVPGAALAPPATPVTAASSPPPACLALRTPLAGSFLRTPRHATHARHKALRLRAMAGSDEGKGKESKLEAIFRYADTDGDGRLSTAELTDLFITTQQMGTSPDILESLLQMAVQGMLFAPNSSELLDKDGLKLGGLRQMYEDEAGPKSTEELIAEDFRLLGLGGGDADDTEEAPSIPDHLATNSSTIDDTRKKEINKMLEELFQVADKDGNGYIDEFELSDYIAESMGNRTVKVHGREGTLEHGFTSLIQTLVVQSSNVLMSGLKQMRSGSMDERGMTLEDLRLYYDVRANSNLDDDETPGTPEDAIFKDHMRLIKKMDPSVVSGGKRNTDPDAMVWDSEALNALSNMVNRQTEEQEQQAEAGAERELVEGGFNMWTAGVDGCVEYIAKLKEADPDEDKDAIEIIFDRYDTNNDGALDEEECGFLLRDSVMARKYVELKSDEEIFESFEAKVVNTFEAAKNMCPEYVNEAGITLEGFRKWCESMDEKNEGRYSRQMVTVVHMNNPFLGIPRPFKTTSEEVRKTKMKAIFDFYDSDNDGLIMMNDYVRMFSDLTTLKQFSDGVDAASAPFENWYEFQLMAKGVFELYQSTEPSAFDVNGGMTLDGMCQIHTSKTHFIEIDYEVLKIIDARFAKEVESLPV